MNRNRLFALASTALLFATHARVSAATAQPSAPPAAPISPAAPTPAQIVAQSGPKATWTVDDVVAKARELSPSLQRARAAQEDADWKRVEALGGFMPRLSIGGTRYFDQRYMLTDVNFGNQPVEVPNILPNTVFSGTASVTLFDGLANVQRYRAARSLSHAAAHEADWTEFRLEQDVRIKFFQALAAEKLAEVADQNVKTLEDHLAKTKLLRRGGVSTEFDVLRTDAQLSEAHSDRLLAYDNVSIARRALAETIGFEAKGDATEPISGALEGELPEPKQGLTDGAQLGQTMQARLDLQAAREKTDAARATDHAFGAFWAPRVDLVGTHIWYNNLDWSWDTDRFRSAYQIGLQLSWTIFDLGSIARSQQTAAQRLEAERTLRIAQLRVPNEFDLWKRKYVYAVAVHAAKTATLDKSKEAVRLAQEGFRAGVRTNTEVLDAELDLFRARAGVVSSRLSAVEASINLELALGRKLSDVR